MTEDAAARPKGDPIAHLILSMIADGAAVSPLEVAQAHFAARRKPSDKPDGWRRYLTPVKQQMVALARAGKVEIVRRRKGEVVNPDDFRGMVKIRLPMTGDAGADTSDQGADPVS